MKTIKILSILVFSAVLFNSCYYDSEEYLYPQNFQCDTSNVTYTEVISDIMETSCNSCHGGGSTYGGVITNTYDGLKELVDNGQLWGTINHESGYKPMPQGKPQLPECELNQIKVWIENGALEN